MSYTGYPPFGGGVMVLAGDGAGFERVATVPPATMVQTVLLVPFRTAAIAEVVRTATDEPAAYMNSDPTVHRY